MPDEVHATLRKRAASAGMSLQEYLLGRLVAEATTPTSTKCSGEPVSGRAVGRASATRSKRCARSAAHVGRLAEAGVPYRVRKGQYEYTAPRFREHLLRRLVGEL